MVPLRRGLELAFEHGLDLVEVAPMAKPPVCRIMNFSKYKYDQEKKERRVKRHQKVMHLKQIRVKPHIDENDYHTKVKQASAFLKRKDKVKLNMFFRGREMQFREQGEQILRRFIHDLEDWGQPERSPYMEGKIMSVVVLPIAEKKAVEDRERKEE